MRRAWPLVVLVVLACVCAACLAFTIAPGVLQYARETQVALRGTPTPINPADFVEIDVRDLEKAPGDYRGAPVLLRGEVFNIDQSSGRTFLQMWVRWPGGGRLDRVAVAVTYVGELPDVYEESAIVVYGRGDGTASGANAFGGSVTQPRVRAEWVELDD